MHPPNSALKRPNPLYNAVPEETLTKAILLALPAALAAWPWMFHDHARVPAKSSPTMAWCVAPSNHKQKNLVRDLPVPRPRRRTTAAAEEAIRIIREGIRKRGNG